MKVHLVTYCSELMTTAARVCVESALRNKVDSADIHQDTCIDQQFSSKNKNVLSKTRGAGYWLWKPYIIDKNINSMNDGDILIYADAGVEIINNVYWVIDRMKQDIFLFGNMYQHVHWCKMDVIKAICPTMPMNQNIKQVQASVIFIRVSKWSKEFVKRWLDYCQRPGFIDDSRSSSPNHPEFREHRHDQSVLTCLAWKCELPLHWWGAIYNGGIFTYDHNGYNDVYPPIFHHHRMRNSDFDAYRKLGSSAVNDHINNYIRRKGYKILS